MLDAGVAEKCSLWVGSHFDTFQQELCIMQRGVRILVDNLSSLPSKSSLIPNLMDFLKISLLKVSKLTNDFKICLEVFCQNDIIKPWVWRVKCSINILMYSCLHRIPARQVKIYLTICSLEVAKHWPIGSLKFLPMQKFFHSIYFTWALPCI